MLNPERLSKDEYEMQYYGFCTTQFMHEFKTLVKQIIQNTLTDMEQELVKNGCKTEKLKKGIDELYLLYMESVNTMLKKFEIEFINIFSIPNNVLLEEDMIKSIPVSSEEFKNLSKNLIELENQIIKEKVFLAKCKHLKEMFVTDIEPIHKTITNLLTIENRVVKKNSKELKKPKKMLQLFMHKTKRFTEAKEETHEYPVNVQTAREDFF